MTVKNVFIVLTGFILGLFSSLYGQAFKWTNNGPYGSRISAVAIDPGDTNIVYAGTYGHGIFRSEDAGHSWKAINQGLHMWQEPIVGSSSSPGWWFGDYYPITTIRIDSLQPSRIWVGTDGGGVAYSMNRGDIWVPSNKGLPDSARITVLLPLENNPSLFAGTKYPSGGLFESLDGGLSWALVDSIPHGDFYSITTIAQHPDSENVVYVGSADELFKSSDGGNSWRLLSRFLPAYDLAIDPDNPQKMWAVMTTDFFDNLLFTSEDGGHHWMWNRDLPAAGGLYTDPFWNFYVPFGRPTPVYRSMNRGKTWEATATDLPTAPISLGSGPNIAVNPRNASSVYFGTFASLYHSMDGGETVARQDKGMLNIYIKTVAVHPRNSSIVYAGEDWGLWKSSDGGASWIQIHTDIINAIAIDPQFPDTLYWAGDSRMGTNTGLMRSFDGGRSWTEISGLTGSVKTAIAVRPDSTNVIFAAAYPSQLYKSTDYGQNWRLVFDENAALWIETIVFDPTSPDIAYFGTARNEEVHGIYKTTDGGETWTALSDPGQVVAIALHPTNSDTLYIITTEDVMISENGGQDFRSIKGAISAQSMSDIILDPLNPERLFLGTKDLGILYSENAGAIWQPVKGLGNPRVTSLAFISNSPGRLIVGTHGGSVWVGHDISTSVERPQEEKGVIPDDFELMPAYPNPFNPATTIRYQLFRDAHIALRIYTVLGKQVRTLVDRFQTSGNYTVTWDGTDSKGRKVATGVYIAMMETRNATKEIKLLFLK